MEVKELLERVKPLLRAKNGVENIERKISTYQEIINSLELQKKQIMDEHDEDEVLSEIESWAESLPADMVTTSEIRQLLKALEYLNK